MTLTPQEQDLTALMAPKVAALGFRLLWVEMKSNILSVFCENPQTGRITLDECGQISRALSSLLETADPIEGAYRLEVSSAGIDRPLFDAADYARFKGMEVKIELDEAVDAQSGQRRFKGVIEGTTEGVIHLDCPDIGKIDLPLSKIHKAKLVMSEALIKATQPKEQTKTV